MNKDLQFGVSDEYILQKLIKVREMGDFNNDKYPVCSLKPKNETNVTHFLQKYPEFNGKDTIIAILGKTIVILLITFF